MADKRIKDLTNTATESDIASGNYIALDGSAGTKKLNSTTLLTKTAQNALAGNVAQAFDPTRTSANPYKAGESVAYEGKTYTFKVNHYGAWNTSHVFDGLPKNGSSCACVLVGAGVTAIRFGFISVDKKAVYKFELSDIDWPVTSLTSDDAYKFSITGIKNDGSVTDLVVYYKNSQIKSSSFNVLIPEDVVGIYIFFRGDVGCEVSVTMSLLYSYSLKGFAAFMSKGSYGSYKNANGIITYNVIPTNGSKYVKLKIDALLGENETFVFSYSFFTVDNGVVPLNAPGSVPSNQRLGSNNEVFGNTTGELEVEIPQNAVGFCFGLFKQVDGVTVSIQDPYYMGSVSYFLYDIPNKIDKLVNQTLGAQFIELEMGTFLDGKPTSKISNNYRVRNKDLIPVTKYFGLPLISGFLYWVFCFDDSLNVLSRIGWVKQLSINDLPNGVKYVNFAVKDNLLETRNISDDLSYLQSLINNDSTLEVARFVEFESIYNPVSHYNSSGWKSRFNLVHTTDNHVNPNRMQTVSKLKEIISLVNFLASNVDAVVDTGDLTHGHDITSELLSEEFALAKDVLVKSQKPVLVSLGNHDGNDNSDSSQNLTPQQQWEWLYSALESRFSNIHFGDKTNYKAYCYLDLTRDSKGLRIIMLDQLDSPSYETKVAQNTAIYSQSQIDWLVGLLENTPANYGVVICNHFPFAPYRASGYSNEWPCLNDGSFAQGWEMIPEIVQALTNRTTLEKTYDDTNGLQDISVNADFSSVANSVQFCFYMCGHTHSKNTFYVKQEGGTNYNQLMLVEGSSGYVGLALDKVWRDLNGPVGNEFSVLSVDLDEHCVYRTSFGAYHKFNEATASPITKIPFSE